MKSEAIVYVDLGRGKCAEVAIRVVEEGLPTPHEGCHFREPSVSEMETITSRVWAETYSSTPPFPIERPTRFKPIPAGAPFVPPAHSDLGNLPGDLPARTAKPWWARLFPR
jgi:hypothetical protein